MDLILGGHDHVYEKRKVESRQKQRQMVAEINIILLQVNGTYILKSGTDFRQFSLLTLDFREVIIFPHPLPL